MKTTLRIYKRMRKLQEQEGFDLPLNVVVPELVARQVAKEICSEMRNDSYQPMTAAEAYREIKSGTRVLFGIRWSMRPGCRKVEISA